MKNYRFYVSLGCFALALVSLSLFMVGCANEADKHIETAKGLYSQSVAHRDKGETDQEIRALEKALNEFQRISKIYPNRSYEIEAYLYQIWEKNYKQINYEAASLVVENLVKNFPESLWLSLVNSSLSLIAREYENKGRYEAARRAYQELIDKFPNDQAIMFNWYELGNVNYKLKKYEDARKAFRIFIFELRSPNSAIGREARRSIAQSYLDEIPKNYNQAYLNFDKLTTAEFKDNTNLQAEAMYKTAYCLKQLKVNDEALGRYAEFMTRFPDSKYIADAYFDLGKLYSDNKNNYEFARFNYNRALQSPKSPNHSKAKIQLEIGGTYYNQGDFEKARNVYNLLLQEYQGSEEALTARLLIASSYRREKRVDEAIRAYENMIANYAEGSSLNRSFKSLISYIVDDGLRLREDLTVMSYYEIGEGLSEKKDFEKAFDSYARIVRKPGGEEKDFRKNPLAPFALHKAMVALRKLGRKDELETFATTYISTLGDINELRDDELILSAEAQLKFADVLRKESEEGEELEDYNKAAAEYAKLEDYPPKPYPRLNLIKLRGKYYESLCYENGTMPDKSIETYREAMRLFESIFKPLVDNPNIDVPNGTEEVFDYCIQTALDYAKKIRTKLKVVDQKLDGKTGKAGNSTNQDIISMALASTVLLKMNNSSGISRDSGFFVGHGLIATNYHVVKGAVEGTARIVNTDRTYAIVGYTAVDSDRDLAILKVRAFGIEPLPFGNSDEINIGEAVYPIGNPLGLVSVVSDGQISSIQWVEGIREFLTNRSQFVSDVQKKNTPHKLLMMTAPISGGNSGGPVLNADSEVIGISVGSGEGRLIRYLVIDKNDEKMEPEHYVKILDRNAQNLNFAVPVNYLTALLKRTGPLKPLSDLEVVN